MKGYTLVEVLVVIAIMAILGTTGYANYISFSSNQILTDGVNKIQSLLRAAQTNATASVIHNNSTCFNWSVRFNTDKKTLSLFCETQSGDVEKSPPLTLPEGVTINTITAFDSSGGSICTSTNFAAQSAYTATTSYSTLYGKPTLILAKGDFAQCPDPDVIPAAIPIARFIVEIKYERGTTSIRKNIRVSTGGQINVE